VAGNCAELIESLQNLPPEQLEEVRRQLFFNPHLQQAPGVPRVQAMQTPFDVDDGVNVEFAMTISGGMRSPGSVAWQSPGGVGPGGVKLISSDPQVMNRPSPSPRQSLSRVRQVAAPSVNAVFGNKDGLEQDVVVISSLSLDWEELAKVPGICMYELRLLWHLYLLRNPKLRVVFCTSQHVPEELVDYYLGYLPNGVTVANARKRLLMLACNDQRAFSVTEKLLQRDKAVTRMRKFIDPTKAYMTCFNTTDSEVELAERMNVLLLGNGTDVAFWGTKAGNRQIFKEAGVQHPDGSYESAFDPQSLANGVVALWKRHPTIKKIMVKLNESFSGEGNAILRATPALREVVVGPSKEQAVRAVVLALETTLEYVAACETWEHYSSQITKLGAICEAFVEGSAEAKTSPSCQAYIGPGGDVQVFATHEQWLNGQIYLGCYFPANLAYASDLIKQAELIGKHLGKHKVVGYIAVDFVSVLQEDSTYEHHAIEVNVRMGGTTHPIMTLDLLCANGKFDRASSQYIASDGTPRYYIASDNMKKKSYQGLLTADLMDLVRANSERIEWNKRPGAPETGCIFHLVPLLSELGKCGCVCVGRSREEAQQIFNDVTAILDTETGGAIGEVLDADEADRIG